MRKTALCLKKQPVNRLGTGLVQVNRLGIGVTETGQTGSTALRYMLNRMGARGTCNRMGARGTCNIVTGWVREGTGNMW